METMTLNFTTRERYARAVRRLMADENRYQIIQYGKYLFSARYFGYVEFKRKQA